ncbi:MAG: sulfatase [Phycisphaeraceae bacterium]
MRLFQVALIILALALVAWMVPKPVFAETAPPQVGRADAPPNIVFFLVDDLGWTDVGCFGSSFYETPNIDRLAKEGVRFTHAYAACHVCSPTRASIMTGKYPARLGLTDWLPGRRDYDFQVLKSAEKASHLALEETTLAEALKAHGYTTGHFGKWHLGEEPNGPIAQGFVAQVPRWNKGWPASGYLVPFKLEGIAEQPGQYLTDRLTDEALKFVEKNKDRPFFLYLSHFAVHDPIQGRPDLVEKYRKKLATTTRPKASAFILEGNPDDKQPLSRKQFDLLINERAYEPYKVLPQRTVKIKQHQDNVEFAAMVESMDESLGRVKAKLEALGLTDNTIIVFYSDNGGMSGANFGNPARVIQPTLLDQAYSTSNLPLRGGKGWIYEGGIRVPMIVKWPAKGKEGAVCNEPVISPDFYPTLLEMAGLPAKPSQHVDGKSFAAAVKGEPFERGAVYWHFPHYSNHGMQSPSGAIRDSDYKLIEYFENQTVQLFNLKDDPGEQNDLANTNSKKAAELRAKLESWRKDVSAKMPMPK